MCDRVNKESRQIGRCRRCHSAARKQIPQNVTCWGSRAAQAPQSPRRIKPWQHMPTQFTTYTPDLKQSGQHNSIWALPGTQVSPWATPHHADETGWHRCTNRPEEWAWQRAAMISSCHYLPSRSQVQPHRNMHTTSTETLGADLKAMPSLSPRCGSLSGGWMLSIGVTEISALGTKKNLAMSQSLFESDSVKRQETVTAVLWRSQTRASVYSWFIGAGTETTSLWPCTNSRFLKVETRN